MILCLGLFTYSGFYILFLKLGFLLYYGPIIMSILGPVRSPMKDTLVPLVSFLVPLVSFSPFCLILVYFVRFLFLV